VDALPDHAALKLGKSAGHLKHQLASRCRCVDRLLISARSYLGRRTDRPSR
jgi:hypothetical protein